jgi:hypothetical protein
MRVGIIQSAYVPWRGYFDFIRSVDVFVLFDDIAISRPPGWRVRNRVKLPEGVRWLTVPLDGLRGQPPIDAVTTMPLESWMPSHLGLLRRSFARAPFADDAIGLWQGALGQASTSLSDLNHRLIGSICDYLGIKTTLRQARPLGATGHKSERLLSVLQALGATSYLSGPAAQSYLDVQRFADAGIDVLYKTYDYPPYPQSWGPFVGEVTVLDLIAHLGPASAELMVSETAPVPVLPDVSA